MSTRVKDIEAVFRMASQVPEEQGPFIDTMIYTIAQILADAGFTTCRVPAYNANTIRDISKGDAYDAYITGLIEDDQNLAALRESISGMRSFHDFDKTRTSVLLYLAGLRAPKLELTAV